LARNPLQFQPATPEESLQHRNSLLLFISTFLLIASAFGEAREYAVGADVSFLRQAEQQGIVFKETGVATPVLEMLKAHGYNWVRLRIFHTPSDLPNNLDYTIASAKAAKKLGFHLLLDFHYSDTWADPGKQYTPKAWVGLSHDQLVKAVFDYTRDTIAAFGAAGVLPDMVQVGNEITAGMLWPDGRLPDHWDHFAALLKAGIAGVAAGAGDSPHPRIMIHIDRGGDEEGTKYFFDKLNFYHVPYDVIGQSYYPWWHGGLNQLRDNLRFMAKTYKKDIIVVETAYNWKPTEFIKKSGQFPETPEGQKQFLAAVDRVVRETPDGLGKGVFWWEPAVPPQPISSRSFFDDNGNVLPVITVFDPLAKPQD
jgi:arabinogalactan endo-1,4-beta-galactosidase